ncbi:MAG: molybdenum cofactor guanylyltransferase [Sphingomonadales bacterium]
MTALGVVLAGGASRRFGSDKALALLGGRPLIDHAIAALSGCTIAVAGRDWPGVTSLPDRPAPDLGPLGGLNAALHHAAAHGFTYVVSLPVDCPALPADWLARLGPGPAHALGQPLVGLWPVSLAAGLDGFLGRGQRRVRDWVGGTGARAVDLGPLANLNHRDDLARMRS